MTILTVNAGSSSIRLAAFAQHDQNQLTQLASGHYELGDTRPSILLRRFAQEHGITDVAVVAHRIVHGGAKLVASCLLDSEVEAEIERLSTLAPLHNPIALAWIRACREVLGPGVVQVGVLGTAFYAGLPEVAQIYALPRDLCRKYDIRRYGFHGLAHPAMWQRWREVRPEVEGGGRVISLQLGAGCSITAIDQGIPQDTSMGFSPVEGLVMATRSGDVDPSLVTFLQRVEDLTPEETDRLLNKGSGLLGVSGVSHDMRLLLNSNDQDARLAVDLYCYRARKYVGAYMAVLGGADTILFGGGVGENAPSVREQILAGMEWCGIVIDKEKNMATVGKEGCISSKDSKIDVWVISVDEATLLAREALPLMAKD